MARIEVEGRELTAAAVKVEQVVSATQGFASLGGIDGGPAAAGNAEAAAALESFLGVWRYGLGCLVVDGERLTTLLQTAAEHYASTDNRIAQAAR